MALAIVVVIVVAVGSGAAPSAAAPGSPEPRAWIIVDADSGAVLAAANEHEPLRPASTSKIMTALIAVERLDPSRPIEVSATAAAQPPSKIGASEGERWNPLDAVAAITLESANDMAYALAETIGDGDLASWSRIVNDSATRLGMTDSTFADPAGFDAPGEAYGGGSWVSVYDTAIATRNAMAVPALATLAASGSYDFTWPSGTPDVMENHNPMLAGGNWAYSGATGFKTGFTEAAGRTMVATARRDGRSIIVVAFGTYDIYAWSAQLLDQGFATEPGTGSGVTLPPIAVEPYASREADLLAFVGLARGGASGDAEIDPASATDAELAQIEAGESGTAETELAPGEAATGEPATDAATSPNGSTADSSAEGSEWELPLTALLLGGLVAVGVGIAARRRQIRLRKARRAARRRQTARAMQRGTLPVAGSRPPVARRASSPPPRGAPPTAWEQSPSSGAFGPPSESHVRLVPARPETGRPRGAAAPTASPPRSGGHTGAATPSGGRRRRPQRAGPTPRDPATARRSRTPRRSAG